MIPSLSDMVGITLASVLGALNHPKMFLLPEKVRDSEAD